ncbi:DNA-directed RNA polymerase, subunit E'' [Candidatus Micrarchaeota archaeon]|nr:DNA-directed RNA polymerase, subunit E'' [Candidatus Micrarchaeota archaeon]
MIEKACKNCRLIVTGDICPVCKESNLTKSWEGYILVIDPTDSEIANAIGAQIPGKYALKIKT